MDILMNIFTAYMLVALFIGSAYIPYALVLFIYEANKYCKMVSRHEKEMERRRQ